MRRVHNLPHREHDYFGMFVRGFVGFCLLVVLGFFVTALFGGGSC